MYIARESWKPLSLFFFILLYSYEDYNNIFVEIGLNIYVHIFQRSVAARVTIHPDAHTLVIRDSNLRRMNSVPGGWKLEGFCGCKRRHIHCLSNRSSKGQNFR